MFSTKLNDVALRAPIRAGRDELLAVSGYASPGFVYQHFEDAAKYSSKGHRVSLIIGMAGADGIRASHHSQYVTLARSIHPKRFECWYLKDPPPVHAKVYVWRARGEATDAFAGSANFTHNGFGAYREVLACVDPIVAEKHFEDLLDDSINCLDPVASAHIDFFRDARPTRIPKARVPATAAQLPTRLGETVTISLLDRRGTVPSRSGLNWGQRPELNRDLDQAYIRVPSSVAHSHFFPPRGSHFTVVCDDGFSFDAVIAQGGDKAIHSTESNAIIGKYIRRRLGMKDGAPITRQDLNTYGRTDVSFSRIDEDTYWLDFTRP